LNKFQSGNCDKLVTSTDLFLLLRVLFVWQAVQNRILLELA